MFHVDFFLGPNYTDNEHASQERWLDSEVGLLSADLFQQKQKSCGKQLMNKDTANEGPAAFHRGQGAGWGETGDPHIEQRF